MISTSSAERRRVPLRNILCMLPVVVTKIGVDGDTLISFVGTHIIEFEYNTWYTNTSAQISVLLV